MEVRWTIRLTGFSASVDLPLGENLLAVLSLSDNPRNQLPIPLRRDDHATNPTRNDYHVNLYVPGGDGVDRSIIFLHVEVVLTDATEVGEAHIPMEKLHPGPDQPNVINYLFRTASGRPMGELAFFYEYDDPVTAPASGRPPPELVLTQPPPPSTAERRIPGMACNWVPPHPPQQPPAYPYYAPQQPPAYPYYAPQQPPAYPYYAPQKPPAYPYYAPQQAPAYQYYAPQQPPAYQYYAPQVQQQPAFTGLLVASTIGETGALQALIEKVVGWFSGLGLM